MSIKPFAIQGADLTLGGVNLQAGTTGVVIPGVTQATNYRAEEVERRITIGGNNPDIFGSNEGAVTVIDNSRYLQLTGTAPSGSYVAATYSVGELDDGRIEEVDVESVGTFAAADKTRVEAADMWATTTPTPFVSFNSANWTQIPYRPKMRAGAVENVGGGGSTGNFTFEADTISNDNGLILSTDRGTLAIGTNMEAPGVAGHFHIGFNGSNGYPPSSDLFLGDDYNYVKLPGYELNPADHGVEIGTHDRDGGSSNTWRFGTDGSITFPDNTIQTTAYTGQGGGSNVDPNVWVQTFVSSTPLTDLPQVAVSVEYDSDGNVIALFSHFQAGVGGPDTRYYSVGKYTPAGTKIWTARFSDDLETDGWGLAVDSVGGWIYVAGKTGGGAYPYDQATLTKINTNNGSVEWNRIYDFGFDSSSNVVDVDSDGHPVMVGYVNVDNNSVESYLTVTKIDKADGTVTWSRKLDGQADEEAYGMGLGPNNEVVAVGYMSQLAYGSNGAVVTAVTEPVSNVNWITNTNVYTNGVNFDVTFNAGVPTIVINYDDNGNRTVGQTFATILGSNFGGTDGIDDMVVKVDSISGSGDQDDRIVVVKYASNGTIAWQKAIQFDAGWDCNGADADIDSQGNIYICGQYTYEFNGGPIGSGIGIVKLNSMGVKQWSRRVVGDCITVSTSIVVGPDDKLYISGVTGYDGPGVTTITWVVAKYDFNGLVEWQRLIDNTASWSFSGQFFSGEGGGSNIAVREGYVALSGGFGDLSLNEDPHATVVQVPASGDVFTVGNWDFTAASFSGILSSDASDITVINAGLADSNNASAIDSTEQSQMTEVSNFLVGTLYTAPGGNDSLVNGAYSVTLENNGTVTLPAGGTITEGYVTSNPTIQLTPASPDVASQKLVIKGGASGTSTTQNGITIFVPGSTWTQGNVDYVYVESLANAGQTLYWWIYPEGAGLTIPSSGTVALNGSGNGTFTFTLVSDNYEFTVRVSPEEGNYGPVTGVESILINNSAPTFATDYHLHLTTGNLAETSIFLGTDNHNVRTTTDGGIEITTETTTGTPPATITISGADVAGVNLIYTRDLAEATPTWKSPNINPVSDPYIVFDGQWEIVAPDYGTTPLYVNTGTLNIPLAQWNTNPPMGSVAPTGVYTYIAPDVHAWQFNTDGSIEFPTQTTPDYANRSDSYTTGPTLQLADNGTDSTVVITGPSATLASPYAKRLVIQGQPGWRGSNIGTTGTEGGDVYIWGGYGGEGSNYTGDGGDVKLRGGNGGQSGGYVRLESGLAKDGDGVGGFLDLNAGDATASGGIGGPVEIRGGRGVASGGAVNIHTATTNIFNNQWTFANDGSLTLPKNSSVSEVTPATGAAANVIVIQSASSIANVSFVSLPPAPILNYTVPGTDIVVNVNWTANGIDYHAPSFTVVDGGTGHTGGGQFGGGEVLTVPYADMGITTGGNWTWYVVDIASDLVLEAGLKDWTFSGDGVITLPNSMTIGSYGTLGVNAVVDIGGDDTRISIDNDGAPPGFSITTNATGGMAQRVWRFGPDGDLTLPGAVVNSTVAKTGVILPTTTGIPLTLSGGMTGLSLADGTYGPVTIGGVTFSVTVTGGGISGYINISSTTSYAVNATIGQLTSEALGATAGQTTNVGVDSVVQETPTALDLTKSVNKLTDGDYTLADGVEGQIMYIVRQNGSTAANIFVEVASARWDGSVYSDQPVIPFQIPFTDMVTIIFTDGAWQTSTFGSLT